jgi:hypothetical protein
MQKELFQRLAVGVLAAALVGGLVMPPPVEAGCKICQTWKNLRAKCWPKRIGGGGMVVCEFRFAEGELGFAAAEPPPGPETVAYTCAELKATKDVPEAEKKRVLKRACPAPRERQASTQARKAS